MIILYLDIVFEGDIIRFLRSLMPRKILLVAEIDSKVRNDIAHVAMTPLIKHVFHTIAGGHFDLHVEFEEVVW